MSSNLSQLRMIRQVIRRLHDDTKPKYRLRALNKFREWYFGELPKLEIESILLLLFGDETGNRFVSSGGSLFHACGQTSVTISSSKTSVWTSLNNSRVSQSVSVGSTALALFKAMLDTSSHPSYSKLCEVVTGLSVDRLSLLCLTEHILSKDQEVRSTGLEVVLFLTREGQHSSDVLLSRSELAMELFAKWLESLDKELTPSDRNTPDSIASDHYCPVSWGSVDLSLPLCVKNRTMAGIGTIDEDKLGPLSNQSTTQSVSSRRLLSRRTGSSSVTLTSGDPLRVVSTDIGIVDSTMHTKGIGKAIEAVKLETSEVSRTHGDHIDQSNTESQNVTSKSSGTGNDFSSNSSSINPSPTSSTTSKIRRWSHKLGNKLSPRRKSGSTPAAFFPNDSTAVGSNSQHTDKQHHGTSVPAAPQANQRSPHHTQEYHVPTSASLLSTSKAFDPGLFLCTVHNGTSLDGILYGLQNLKLDDDTRNQQMQRLVRDNIHEFVHCRYTIDQISNLLQSNEVSVTHSNKKVRGGLDAIDKVSNHLDEFDKTLQATFIPALAKRRELSKLRKCRELLRRFEHSLHPAKALHTDLEQGSLESALAVVRESAPLFLLQVASDPTERDEDSSKIPDNNLDQSVQKFGEQENLVQVSCREFENMVIKLADTLYDGVLEPPTWMQNASRGVSSVSTGKESGVERRTSSGPDHTDDIAKLRLLMELWQLCPNSTRVGKYLKQRGDPLHVLHEQDITLVRKQFETLSRNSETRAESFRELVLVELMKLPRSKESTFGLQCIPPHAPFIREYLVESSYTLDTTFDLFRLLIARWSTILTQQPKDSQRHQLQIVLEQFCSELVKKWCSLLCTLSFNLSGMMSLEAGKAHVDSAPQTYNDKKEEHREGNNEELQSTTTESDEVQRLKTAKYDGATVDHTNVNIHEQILLDVAIVIYRNQLEQLEWIWKNICQCKSNLFPGREFKEKVFQFLNEIRNVANEFVKNMFHRVEVQLCAVSATFQEGNATVTGEVPNVSKVQSPMLKSWTSNIKIGKPPHNGIGPNGPRIAVVEWFEFQLIQTVARSALIWGWMSPAKPSLDEIGKDGRPPAHTILSTHSSSIEDEFHTLVRLKDFTSLEELESVLCTTKQDVSSSSALSVHGFRNSSEHTWTTYWSLIPAHVDEEFKQICQRRNRRESVSATTYAGVTEQGTLSISTKQSVATEEYRGLPRGLSHSHSETSLGISTSSSKLLESVGNPISQASWMNNCMVELCAVLGHAAATATRTSQYGVSDEFNAVEGSQLQKQTWFHEQQQQAGTAMMHNRPSVLFAESCLSWRSERVMRFQQLWFGIVKVATSTSDSQSNETNAGDWNRKLEVVEDQFLRLEKALLAQSVDESSAIFKMYILKGLDSTSEPISREPSIRSYTLDILVYLLNTVSEFRCCKHLVGGMTEKFAVALSESLSNAKKGKYGKYSAIQVCRLELEVAFMNRALSLFKSREADRLLKGCQRKLHSLPSRDSKTGQAPIMNEQDKRKAVDQMLNKCQLVVNCVNVSPVASL